MTVFGGQPHRCDMKLELIVRRANHPPIPWVWEILDSTNSLIRRSREFFETADAARAAGQIALAKEAAATPAAATAGR